MAETPLQEGQETASEIVEDSVHSLLDYPDAISTPTFVTATAQQPGANDDGVVAPGTLYLAINTAASLKVEVSADNVTYTTLSNNTAAIGLLTIPLDGGLSWVRLTRTMADLGATFVPKK